MQLQTKPEIKGKIVMQWTIDVDGIVKSVEAAENFTGDQKLEQCVTKIIEKLHFQKPASGQCTVRWPFEFLPGDQVVNEINAK